MEIYCTLAGKDEEISDLKILVQLCNARFAKQGGLYTLVPPSLGSYPILQLRIGETPFQTPNSTLYIKDWEAMDEALVGEWVGLIKNQWKDLVASSTQVKTTPESDDGFKPIELSVNFNFGKSQLPVLVSAIERLVRYQISAHVDLDVACATNPSDKLEYVNVSLPGLNSKVLVRAVTDHQLPSLRADTDNYTNQIANAIVAQLRKREAVELPVVQFVGLTIDGDLGGSINTTGRQRFMRCTLTNIDRMFVSVSDMFDACVIRKCNLKVPDDFKPGNNRIEDCIINGRWYSLYTGL